MKLKKVVLAGILAGIVICVVSLIVQMLVNLVLPYNVMELGGMRAVTDPIMLLFFVHPWVLGFAMAVVYGFLGSSLKGSWLCRGKHFGVLVWLVAALPSAFLVFTSMDYPLGFTVNSVIGSLLYVVAAGMVIAKIME